MATLLSALCANTRLDCDTMDLDFAKEFGPFADCTSNQAISYGEASKTGPDGKYAHEEFIKEAAEWAKKAVSGPQAAGDSMETLAVEYLVVRLLLRFVEHLSGYVLLQINPKYGYDTEKTVATAERIVAMTREIDPSFDVKRLCFKVVSTWPGLSACKILEGKGIATLGTALFCMEQASLAGHMGCTYISPYYNELKVHFDKDFTDTNKASTLCRDATAYYSAHHHKTEVKAASFVHPDEAMHHAGVDSITLFPDIIRTLKATPASSMTPAEIGKFMTPPTISPIPGWKAYEEAAEGRDAWEAAFKASGGGENARKLAEAIAAFTKAQDDLEELVRKVAA
ncbi:related to transaldolase [Cephalotrichum gorgonifer]|uniref:Related to transaldolase n=1 Tax=Cephalotrichum gorgonifer TaxID=2041049 RepID=A0AAE8SZL0_9PEZI|nr:related to transaldolase [Cephalotrichum gorgonifer]